MENNNNSFSYSYSGVYRDELEQYKEKYAKKNVSEKMKKIRTLDRTVDFIATMVSIFIGLCATASLIAGTVILIKQLTPLTSGIFLSVIGVAVIATVPFIHTRIYNAIKEYYSPKILSLIEEIEQNKL